MTDRKLSYAVNRYLRNLPDNASEADKTAELYDKLRNGKISESDFRRRTTELGLERKAIDDCIACAKAERAFIDTLPKGKFNLGW